MAAMGHFFSNSLSNEWNMKPGCWVQFLLQLLIKILAIWHLTALGNFLYNSLSTVLKYDSWLLGAISFTIAYQNHWINYYHHYYYYSSLIIINLHQASSIVINHSQSSLIIVNHHQLSSITINHHWSLLIIITHHQASSITTNHHQS